MAKRVGSSRENPFLLLLESSSEYKNCNEATEELIELRQKRKAEIDCELFERVFGFSLGGRNDEYLLKPRLESLCVYLSETACGEGDDTVLLTRDNIEDGLRERLSMRNPEENLVDKPGSLRKRARTSDMSIYEKSVVKYLSSCYARAQNEIHLWDNHWEFYRASNLAKNCQEIITSYIGSCLISPELILGETVPLTDLHDDFFDVVMEIFYNSFSGYPSTDFFDALFVERTQDDINAMTTPFILKLFDFSKDISFRDFSKLRAFSLAFHCLSKNALTALSVTASNRWLPIPLLVQPFLGSHVTGKAYEKSSLLGRLLTASCIPGPFERSAFFLNPSQQSMIQMESTSTMLRQQMSSLASVVHKTFHNFLKHSETRQSVLQWMASCLKYNASRSQLLNELQGAFPHSNASDGFFLNFSLLMTKLCHPFTNFNSPTLSKIDPQYCSCSQASKGDVTLAGLAKETKLSSQQDNCPTSVTDRLDVSLSTQVFFIAHRAIQLGFHSSCDKYKRLMHGLSRLQRIYRQSGGFMGELGKQFEDAMTRQISYKTQLLDPSLVGAVLSFYSATGQWLVEVAGGTEKEVPPQKTNSLVCHVPEYIVECLADCVVFVRQYNESTLEDCGNKLDNILTFLVTFMGSSQLVKNPHLRAHLAEAMTNLLPVIKSPSLQENTSTTQMTERTRLFEQHSFSQTHLCRSLLQAFVDIEFTGSAEEFEQKFSYRYPMYNILEHVVKIEQYRESLKSLADEAIEQHSSVSTTPIFLKFVNMLLNDAIFLLDEALQYLAKVKEGEDAKGKGEWDNLPAEEKKEAVDGHSLNERMARAHNYLANETVLALNYLTEFLKAPFVLPSMVDRVAAMLNCFLLELVGPKMGAFRVADFEKYFFRPKELVTEIIEIYLHLAKEEQFCAAIPRDGRSYSSSLFVRARGVLNRLGKADLAIGLSEFEDNVQTFENLLKEKERAEINAPEEFKDPITDEVMADPVKLPSSGCIVDRSTIERHLLSDSIDPFNRAPLTIDMVIPLEDLKARIVKWCARAGMEVD